MESSQMQTYIEKTKEFALKYKTALIGAAVAIVVAIAGVSFYVSQPKSVTGAVEVSFSGYDGYGKMEVDYEEIQKEISRVALKSAGFSGNQIDDILNNDEIIMAEIEADHKLESKLKEAQAIIRSTSYDFNKTDELSNGDKVVLSIKTTSSKSPIKKEKKTFTVKGLDPVEKISVKEFLKEYPVTFAGFNGYGKVVLPEDEDGNNILSLASTDNDGSYKNNDKVSLVVSSGYLAQLQEDGKKLDSKKIEVTVEGLKEITDISNTAEALAKNETYAKSQYENSSWTTYTLEKDKSYIAYNTSYSNSSASGQVYLVTVFKVTSTGSSSTTVKYRYFGYRYYVKSDNTLDLETANKEYGYETQDLENLIAELKTDGYKEYSPAA